MKKVYYLRIENKQIHDWPKRLNCFKEISESEYQELLKENKAQKVKFYASILENALEVKAENQKFTQKISKCLDDFIRASYPSCIIELK